MQEFLVLLEEYSLYLSLCEAKRIILLAPSAQEKIAWAPAFFQILKVNSFEKSGFSRYIQPPKKPSRVIPLINKMNNRM